MGEHNKIVCTDAVDSLFVAKPYSFLHKGIQKVQFYSLCLPLLLPCSHIYTLCVAPRLRIFSLCSSVWTRLRTLSL